MNKIVLSRKSHAKHRKCATHPLVSALRSAQVATCGRSIWGEELRAPALLTLRSQATGGDLGGVFSQCRGVSLGPELKGIIPWEDSTGGGG